MTKRVGRRGDFVAPDEKAKSDVVAQIVRMARKERLSHADFVYVCGRAFGPAVQRGARGAGLVPQDQPWEDEDLVEAQPHRRGGDGELS